MTFVTFAIFAAALAISLWTIFATIAPRHRYIVALLSGSVAAPVLQPVETRRRVRRISPLSLRSQAQLMRAAA
ncbi:MAG: hypothetical protein V4659_09210 [Pseudomonadota bacterium]